MGEFKVFNDPVKREERVFFKLIEGSGCVRLIMVDEGGDEISAPNVLKIDSSGLHLNCSVSDTAPFPLDRYGKIIIGEDC